MKFMFSGIFSICDKFEFKLYRDRNTELNIGIGMKNDNFLRFKDGLECWDVIKYSNGGVSEMGNGNCEKLLYNVGLY